MPRSSHLLFPFLLLTACPSREPAPRQRAAPRDVPAAAGRTSSNIPGAAPARVAQHICFGANGSAVQVGPGTPCSSLGASDTPIFDVPVRRPGGTPQPQQR